MSIKNDIAHYNLGNEFFALWLDDLMQYSCGDFSWTDQLDQAQINKLNSIITELPITEGMKVLDLGCGWGGLSRYFKDHDIDVKPVCLSKEQKKHDPNIKLCHWRRVKGSYDVITCIEMLEHVQKKDYTDFFNKVYSLLNPKGRLYLQVITFQKKKKTWVLDNIFPDGHIGTLDEIIESSRNSGLVLKSAKNDSDDYVKTLYLWHESIISNKECIIKMYGQDFLNAWCRYLKTSQEGFKVGLTNLYRIIFEKSSYDKKS